MQLYFDFKMFPCKCIHSGLVLFVILISYSGAIDSSHREQYFKGGCIFYQLLSYVDIEFKLINYTILLTSEPIIIN